MKFLCPSCKAKYQIADDKVAGRTLKMDCRRCGHTIVLRGDQPEAAPAAPAAAGRGGARAPTGTSRTPSSTSNPVTAPAGGARRSATTGSSGRGSSHVGPAPARPAAAASRSGSGALSADFRRSVAGGVSGGAPLAPEPPRTSPLDQWHVAINDVPVGPMRRDEITRKIATGAITADSLAWREGFDDWRPLRDIPELAALLRRSEAQRMSDRPGSRPGAGRPVPPPASRASASASASRGGVAARPASAPAGAAARGGASAGGRSNVVAIGGRLGASAAPALDEGSFDEELDDDLESEPTRVGSALDVFALGNAPAESGRASAVPAAPAPAPARAKSVPPAAKKSAPEPELDALPDPFPAAPASASGASSPGMRAPAAFAPAPAAPLATEPTAQSSIAPQSSVSPQSSIAPQSSVSPQSSIAPQSSISVSPQSSVSLPPSTQRASTAPPKRGGLPVGAWIGIAGAMSFGVAMAVMIAPRLLGPAPDAPAIAATAPVATAPTETAREAVVELPAETASAEPTTPPAEQEEVAAPAEEPESAQASAGHTRRAATTGGGGATPRGSAGAEAATKAVDPAFARFADDGASTVAPIATRPTTTTSARSAGSGSGEGLTGEQIRGVVTREQRNLQNCWEVELRRMPTLPTTRLDIDVTIGASGTVTQAHARGVGVGNLTECIERSVRRWRFPSAGDTSRTSFPLVFQGSR